MSEFAEPNLTATMSTAEVALYLGENNTEARCAVYLTVPDVGLIPLKAITSELERNQAYQHVSLKTFNIGGIIKATDSSLIHHLRDPSPEVGQSSIWVEKTDDRIVSQKANAAAGLLLAFSMDNNRSIRTLLGEKRTSPSGSNSIQNRLGVLAVAFDHERSGRGFDVPELADRLHLDYGISPAISHRHVQQLLKNRVLQIINGRSERLEFAVRPDEQEVRAEVHNLFQLIRTLATGSTEELVKATERGRSIATDPRWLPLLIKRSYATSSHTGKHTTHRQSPQDS